MKPDISEQLQSPSYIVPIEDREFMLRDEMRAQRLALEYAKADLLLKDWGIRSTLIVFGGARVPSPEDSEPALSAARQRNDAGAIERLSRHIAWYEAARAFGHIASREGGALAPQQRWRENVIATGGGSGLMEAANRGAKEAGAPTIGFNIMLPTEQLPNPYITPELTFRFHYFAIRKLHLAMRANALVIFPGGFGTMDELFEILTLCQTRKSRRIPIVLFDRSYWERMINFEALAAEDMIQHADLELFEYAESAEQAWSALLKHGLRLRTNGE